ncbi:hypothetical protein DPMN_127975 [Dreissena polymorpha]|uniref:Uncharacterized protein n=1 Tax=Dreissena polymorpha TaxID=45954 RepID=A0A9D4JZP5_DREPO|nr:hypothetical protein DPMN_127975 [Dreissena polymorpha]
MASEWAPVHKDRCNHHGLGARHDVRVPCACCQHVRHGRTQSFVRQDSHSRKR